MEFGLRIVNSGQVYNNNNNERELVVALLQRLLMEQSWKHETSVSDLSIFDVTLSSIDGEKERKIGAAWWCYGGEIVRRSSNNRWNSARQRERCGRGEEMKYDFFGCVFYLCQK